MSNKLEQLYNYLKANSFDGEAEQILKIAGLTHDEMMEAYGQPSCCGEEFKQGGYDWEVICHEDDDEYQYKLKWNRPGAWVAKKNPDKRDGNWAAKADAWVTLDAHRKNVLSKCKDRELTIEEPEMDVPSGPDVIGYGPDSWMLYGDPDPDQYRSTTTQPEPPQEPVATEVRVFTDEEVFNSLSEPGGYAPADPKSIGRNVLRPQDNWVDNIVANFADYFVTHEEASFKEWKKLNKPDTVPYVVTMRPRGYGQRENIKSFLIARHGDEQYRIFGKPRGSEQETVLNWYGLEGLHGYINRNKPGRTKETIKDKLERWKRERSFRDRGKK